MKKISTFGTAGGGYILTKPFPKMFALCAKNDRKSEHVRKNGQKAPKMRTVLETTPSVYYRPPPTITTYSPLGFPAGRFLMI